MPILIINAILSGLWKRLAGLFRWAVDNPAKAGCIVLLCVSAALYWHSGRVADQRDRALATVDRMIEAQKKATAFAIRMKETFEKQNRSLNDETDKSAATVRTVFREHVLRLKAPRCPTGNTNLPEGGISESVDGPNPEAVVPRTDLLICADNQARLEAANAWAIKMQALAVDPE